MNDDPEEALLAVTRALRQQAHLMFEAAHQVTRAAHEIGHHASDLRVQADQQRRARQADSNRHSAEPDISPTAGPDVKS